MIINHRLHLLLRFCQIFIFFFISSNTKCEALLFPQQSESRLIQDLCGLWSFRIDDSISRNEGFKNMWWTKRLRETGAVELMPVPSSYNDISVNKSTRDHVGWAWYETEFYVHQSWRDTSVVLRFQSVHYNTIVWINGNQVIRHSGGHLPFESVVNSYLSQDGGVNRLTVAVNNTLTPTTLPPGEIIHGDDRYPENYFTQKIYFDFFNYAGIHRAVSLLSVPQKISIQDITIVTKSIDYNNSEAIVSVKSVVDGYYSSISYVISDDRGRVVVRDFVNNRRREYPPNQKNYDKWSESMRELKVLEELDDNNDESANKRSPHDDDDDDYSKTYRKTSSVDIKISQLRLWYPISMATGKNVANQYTLKLTVHGESGQIDVYRQKFGVREIKVTGDQFLINRQPFYCNGVSKHEDSDIRGKGLDSALLARDLQLLLWSGVNCVRTSHYPYAEQFLDLTDQYGIAVIDEAPAVGLRKKYFFSNKTLQHHMVVMKELVDRDKNHPSVIMWSVANEPLSDVPIADYYFKSIIEFTKTLDSRPVTFVANQRRDIAGKYVDVFCFNRYYGWYADIGHTSVIRHRLAAEIEKWRHMYNKPIIMAEYGADTIVGQHMLPSQAFTEEYQIDLITEHHVVFDKYRKSYLVGELYWNFADFMTAQDVKRVVGNKKGLFTRQRQPKMAAYVIKKRYNSLNNETSLIT